MPRPAALHILDTIRMEMTTYTKTRSLYSLAQTLGIGQSICWRILHGDRAASFDNAEKLLVYFGYRLVKDEKADQSRQSTATAKPAPSAKRAASAKTGKAAKITKRRPRKV